MVIKRVLLIVMFIAGINIYCQEINGERINEFLDALRESDINKTEQLLDDGFPINFQFIEIEKATPLHLALGKTSVSKDIVLLLLKKGANIYALDLNKSTPFMGGLFNKDFEKTNLLLHEFNYMIDTKIGPMLDTEMELFASPLTYSIMRGDEEIIAYLLENNINIDPTTEFLFSAVAKNQFQIVKNFASTSFGLNHSVKKYNGSSALFIANENNNHDMVEYLLDNGADINQRNSSLMTVFDIALSVKNYELANKYINKYKYDINQLDLWHRKSLFYFTIKEDLNSIEYLFKHGLDPNSYQYDTSHYLNAYFGNCVRNNTEINIDIVKLYLEYGLNTGEQDQYGYTYFHNVAMTNDIRLIDITSTNIDFLNIKTFDEGNTPLIFSVIGFNHDMLIKLIDLGANINLQNTDGNTASHYLAISKNIELLEFMISNGADFEIENNEGKNVYDLCTNDVFEAIKDNNN